MFAFADDTKGFMKIATELDIQKLQEDLSSVSDWSSNNNPIFSISNLFFTSPQKI